MIAERRHDIDERIALVAYDSRWPRQFEVERERIQAALRDVAPRVEHFGSTAVPRVAAKPIIDVLVGVDDFEHASRCVPALVSMGYENFGEVFISGRIYLRKRGVQPWFNIAITATGSPFWKNCIAVRDFLRAHPQAADSYAAQKVKAVKGGALLFSTYSRAKERFVVSLQSRAAAWLIQVALEDNLWSMCSQFGRGPGCTLHDENGVLWLNTPIPVPLCNIVLRCCADTDADRAIDRVFAHFRARATPFVWLVHPSARPADLKARLERRGFTEVEPVVGMAMELKAPLIVPKPPPGVEVHSVTPASDLPSYVEFVTAGWPVPAAARPHLRLIAETFRIGAAGSPNRAWIAIAGGVAVAKVFAHDSAGVVGLYGVTTRPASQGLGLGRLLCTTALADAQRRGHTLAVSHSTPTAAPLYRNVGFREVAAFSIFGHKGHEEL